MFLGLDSSTQSLSALVIDPASGAIVREVSVNFGSALPAYKSPSGFLPGGKDGEVHADPRMWMEAIDLVFAQLADGFDLSQITALACSGQQHGSLYFDHTLESRLGSLKAAESLEGQLSGALTRATAPIWMDTSTGAECAEIAAAVGGNAEVCRRSGSIAIEGPGGRTWQIALLPTLTVLLSSSTTLGTPRRARSTAMPRPTMPPPTITTG
jgi:xylulokinase